MASEYQVRNTPQFSGYEHTLSSQPYQYGSDKIDDPMQLEATSDVDLDLDVGESREYSEDESIGNKKSVARDSRLDHLSSIAEQLELSFAVASIAGVDGTAYPKSILDGTRLGITRFQDGRILKKLPNLEPEQIKVFTAQTVSKSDSVNILPYTPLPEWFCLDAQNLTQRLTQSNISVANPINILRMAHEYNRNVIFIDPNGGTWQTVIWQNPELSCRCLSINDFYRTADINNNGAPIMVFINKSHIYCFIAGDNPALDHQQLLTKLLERGTAIAFSDEMPRVITNRLYLGNSEQNHYVERLVPTYRGVELKSFNVSDMLANNGYYLLFLKTLAHNMVVLSPDYDSVTARSKVIMKVEDSSSEKKNLAKYITELSESHPNFMSKYKIVQDFAANHKERQSLMEVILALSDIQEFYAREVDIDAKDAMFTLLTQINYTEELRNLAFQHAELHLFRKEMVQAETEAKKRKILASEFATSSRLTPDATTACKRAVKYLAKLDDSSLTEQYKKIFTTAIHDLADNRKQHLLTKKEYDEWFVPLQTALDASCAKKDEEETLHENEISEGIIASLAQQTFLEENYIKLPKNASLMLSWLQKQYPPFNVQ